MCTERIYMHTHRQMGPKINNLGWVEEQEFVKTTRGEREITR